MKIWSKRLESGRLLSYLAFYNVLYMGVSGPSLLIESTDSMIVSFPDSPPTWGKGSGVLQEISWACRMQNSHVILIIGMATHCLVCRLCMQQQCGHICTAGVLSHEKLHAMNLIGVPEIRTATSSSPRNHSKYTRPSSPRGGWVWDRE